MTVPAYILGGGRSRRMGRDKATLRVDEAGPPLAGRVASILSEAGCSTIAVVGRQSELASLQLPVVPDPPVADHHPLYGVAAALLDARLRRAAEALVVPCDLPNLTTQAVQALLRADGPAVGVADGQLQPLFAKLSTAWAEEARAAADGNGSARRFVASRLVAQVEIPADAVADLDTPDDLTNWVRSRAGQE